MHFPNEFDPAAASDFARSELGQPAGFRQSIVAKVNEYRTDLLAEFRGESPGFLHFIRLAVNEAEGLASSTPYAHLLFPTLVEEKIQYVRRWTRHQDRISPGFHDGAGEHGGNTP